MLAGLFFVMGIQALEGNGITLKILFLLKDKSLTPASEPLKQIKRRAAIWIFVAIQLFGFGATFAITQTIAAVGFPIIILLLIPARTFILPKYFTAEELRFLDAPTASPFTMISVGGNFGEDVDSGEETAVQSGNEGVLVGDGEGDSDEGAAERGEGMKRRESWRGEGESGRLRAESFEMQTGMSRRSVSRQSK